MPMEEIVYWLSKEARYKIIDLMLTTRSMKQLARELGITPPAISKYLSRQTHPSDKTMAKALSAASPYEREKILEIIIEDILNAIEVLFRNLEEYDELREYFRKRLEEIMIGQRGE